MAHSSIGLGGSTADQWLNCHGRYQLIMKLPPSVDKPSEYAAEGSAMHEVAADLMKLRKAAEADQVSTRLVFDAALEDMIGDVFLDRELTQEHLDTMITPALEALEELEAEYGGGFKVVAIERSVEFPGISGAFGTVDLILSSKTHILHIDWKFGSGLPVKALYKDLAGDIVNPQLLFYTASSMNSAPGYYKGKKELVIAIIQPRSDEPLSHTVVSRQEIKFFVEDLQGAFVKALQRDPTLHRGEWCRWCPAKIACPKWTSPMLQLADISGGVLERTQMVTNEPSEYGEYLAKAKYLVDMAAQFKVELDKQLHAFLEDGGKVPGWRLKAKDKKRQWIDEEIVDQELTELGFMDNEIWRRTLVSFQSADATAKRRGVKIPNELRVAPVTNETTVCRDDDPAPEVSKPLAIEQFRAALKAIGGSR